MEDVKYNREDALKIAGKLLTDGHLNEVKDKGPFGVEVTVETARGLMTDDAILRDKIKPKIFARMTEKDLFTTEQLTEALAAEGVKIPDAKEKITAAAKQLNLGTPAPAKKIREPKSQPQANAGAEPKTTTTAEKQKDAPPATAPASGAVAGEEEGFWGYFKNLGKRIDSSREGLIGNDAHKGGFADMIQRFILALIYMLGDVAKAGTDNKEPEQKTAQNKQELQQEQEKQLTQKVQLAQAEEAQLEAQKPKKSPEPPRELVVEHFGEGGIRRNTEDMQKFQEALAQSHVPDGTNVSPSSSVGKYNHIQVGPDMSFGRSLG